MPDGRTAAGRVAYLRISAVAESVMKMSAQIAVPVRVTVGTVASDAAVMRIMSRRVWRVSLTANVPPNV